MPPITTSQSTPFRLTRYQEQAPSTLNLRCLADRANKKESFIMAKISLSAPASWANPWLPTCKKPVTNCSCPSITARRRALIAAGAVATPANPQQVAQEAEFIIVMVPDTPQVDDVLFRADGVAAGLSSNKVVIDAGSISPTATKAFAAKINETGAQYLDAPVSGGEIGLEPAP